ncbi:hypothetical protein M501DRAFT_1018623 [Patellaria atrata CBS 101060]|uniref:Uncharacterized protein n=1 Tax=Patellaria atrata CBS 101060 TaxID=1346257 RepID=A0A9P4VKU5_9PEZI|nr:hypothetical protein M501DRAFT_1018623 [Patellaria atrata CBS 101060]
MLTSTLFALLAGTALAVPTTSAVKSPIHPEQLAMCEAAENCETYETPDGLLIRFKAGMEPGSEDYNRRFPNGTEHGAIVKRDTQTHVTFGRTSINYGTTNPCDALHHCLYDYCHEGSCDPNICQTDTQDIVRQGTSSGPRHRTISISANGQYNGWEERDHYVDAVVAAASQGQKWTQHDWCIHTRDGDDCGTQWWGEQTNFVSVNKWYNGNFRGFIQAQVSMDGGDDNWCGRLGGALGSIAGVVNPIAGGFFGFVSALCS